MTSENGSLLLSGEKYAQYVYKQRIHVSSDVKGKLKSLKHGRLPLSRMQFGTYDKHTMCVLVHSYNIQKSRQGDK